MLLLTRFAACLWTLVSSLPCTPVELGPLTRLRMPLKCESVVQPPLQVFVGGVGMDDASAVPARGGSSFLCFPVTCRAPSILTKGVVVQAGCTAGGSIGDACRLGCSIGFDETDAVEGTCVSKWLEHEEVAVAEYANQAVTCSPARNEDGSMVRRLPGCSSHHIQQHAVQSRVTSYPVHQSECIIKLTIFVTCVCRRSLTVGWNR